MSTRYHLRQYTPLLATKHAHHRLHDNNGNTGKLHDAPEKQRAHNDINRKNHVRRSKKGLTVESSQTTKNAQKKRNRAT
jgi:hypothetical protein